MVLMVYPSVAQKKPFYDRCCDAPAPELRHVLAAAITDCSEFSAEPLSRHCLCIKRVTSSKFLPPLLGQPMSNDGWYWDLRPWPLCLYSEHSRTFSAPPHPMGSTEAFVGTTFKFNFTVCPILLPSLSQSYWSQEHSPINLLPQTSASESVFWERDLQELLNKISLHIVWGTYFLPSADHTGLILCFPTMNNICILW